MIECSTAAACEHIAAAQVQFITDALPATILLAIAVALVFQHRAGEVMD